MSALLIATMHTPCSNWAVDIRQCWWCFLGSESCLIAVQLQKECTIPPYVHPVSMYITARDQFTRPSPMLVQQTTWGEKAWIWGYPYPWVMCKHWNARSQEMQAKKKTKKKRMGKHGNFMLNAIPVLKTFCIIVSVEYLCYQYIYGLTVLCWSAGHFKQIQHDGQISG